MMQSGAVIDGSYRYSLWRKWDKTRPCLLWILLNPSTADANVDDPTLRRCIGETPAWSLFGGLEIVNLYAWRATSPRELAHVDNAVGDHNDRYIREAAERAVKIVVAWGAYRTQRRDRAVLALVSQSLWCLGTNRDGSLSYVEYEHIPS